MSLDKRKAIQKATALIQQGRLDKAIAEYEAILRADPSDTSLYNALGDLYSQTGSISEAITCYLRLVEVLRAEGRASRAIAIYKKIIKLDPNNLSELLSCADLYTQEGLRAEAKRLYLLAAERSLKLGSVKQALELYERLIHLEPGDTTIAAKLASLLEGQGKRSQAVDLLGRLAEEVRAQGRLDDARLLYQQMVEIDPATFTGWYGLGHLEFEAGRFQAAEAHLKSASAIDAASVLPHILLGHLYERQRRPDLAKAAWRALLEFYPGHQEAHHLLGKLLLKEGETEAAVREFDAVASILAKSEEPGQALTVLGELGAAADHPLIKERLGEILSRLGRSAEAKAAYHRGAELYLASGNFEERRRVLNHILTLYPDDPEAVEGLATESVGQEGLVTVGHAEPPSYTSPIEVSELGGAGATSRQDEPLELHEETPRGVDRAEQEDVTILSAEKDFLAGMPDPFAAVDFYLNQGLDGEARSLLRRLVEINPGNTEAARYLALLESAALTEDATVGQEIEVIHLEPVEGVKDPPFPPAPLVEVEHIEKSEEVRTEPPLVKPDGVKGVTPLMATGQEIEVIHLEPVEGVKDPPFPPAPLVEVEHIEKSKEVRTEPPLVKPDGVKGVTPLMAKMEPPLVPAQEKGLGPADAFLDEYLDEPDVLRPVDRSPEDCESHYQLGVAYQEMGLLEDAIAEFRRSATDERLRLPATNMVGLCLLSKGNVEAAIKEFRSGLEIVGRPAEEYLGIKYDLATAYQAMGDFTGAEALYRELEATSPSFRDVKSRLTKLQGRMSKGKGHPAAPRGRTDAPRRTRSR